MQYNEPIPKTLAGIFLCFLLIQCSNNSTPEQLEFLITLDEIPQLTQEAEKSSGNDEALRDIQIKRDVAFTSNDESRIWVSTVVEDTDIYEWWVLAPTGEVLTKFNWAKDKIVKQIRNGYLYTKEKNQEGADEVVRYSISIN